MNDGIEGFVLRYSILRKYTVHCTVHKHSLIMVVSHIMKNMKVGHKTINFWTIKKSKLLSNLKIIIYA